VAVGRRQRDGNPLHAIVVCDGVSSSSHGEQASDHAARAALAVLVDAADGAAPLDPEGALRAAVAAAHRAACEAAIELVPGKDAPGTTLVAALAHAGRVDVAWVGDSRAYLVGPPLADGSALTATALTRDHSWVNMVVDAGQMTEAEAMHSPYAHALVHCLGPLEDPDPTHRPEPSLGHVSAERGSRLVVCSDGLWNYAPSPEDIAALLARPAPGSDARTIAWDLIHHALAMGGHDDVTVAVALL
jgi:serine/threonine protein phosphatase PrpC